MFSRALLETFRGGHELVALLDTNPARMDFWNRRFQEEYGVEALPTYAPDRFDAMIREQRIDTVVVTSMDRTHHHYICAAMEAGADVISEKPMTTTAEYCRQVLDTKQRTGRDLTVTFNYRYASRNSKVKELLLDGVIGKVHSIHFEWLLNTKHGADYFRRWHRQKENSGGLMVHKSTHHFDLVNWWLGASPQTVYAQGGLTFYGKENARRRGVTEFYERAHGSAAAADDPFALDLAASPTQKGLYLDAEHVDGYYRDRSVFSDGIDIEDDVSVLVGYDSGATMSYHLTAYSPWEGYRVAFNGSEGRLELTCVETAYVSASEDDHNFARNVQGGSAVEVSEPTRLVLQNHWEKPRQIELPQVNAGGHGGGDEKMLQDIFAPDGEDRLGRRASHVDGARSILAGIAANRSMETGQAVDVASLVPQLAR
jgi:predicted dehydrogenase